MPKFVSGSSGHIYAQEKSAKKKDDDDLLSLTAAQDDSIQKPSAINKKGAKEQRQNSLDIFKEELRRLQEERQNQRNRLKTALESSTSPQSISPSSSTQAQTQKPPPVPVPLKPDPRCPTALTLQVNLNPKDRESSVGGSHDNGDPTTTNIYLGNINPTANENDLRDMFGKFGPLASIKIMWPRTEEERARNRNSGFVAYMSRVDAERAIKSLNGRDFKGYDMKLGSLFGTSGLEFNLMPRNKDHEEASTRQEPTYQNTPSTLNPPAIQSL